MMNGSISVNNIINSLKTIRHSSCDGPEGLYNEYSLVRELINHLLDIPTMTEEQWYIHFQNWERYIREEPYYDNDDTWFYACIDQLDLIYDFAEIIFK